MSTSIQQELNLMRMSLQALRDQINYCLAEIDARLARLLPPENTARYQRYKNYTTKDWHKLLDPSIKHKRGLKLIK